MKAETTRDARYEALRWMDRWVDPLLLFLAACAIPLLIIELSGPAPEDERLVVGAVWAIWGAFTINLVARLVLARERVTQLKLLAVDLILIVGQPLYAYGPRKANADILFVLLVVILGRTVLTGRLLRRTGSKLRKQPLRVLAFAVPFIWLTSAALIYRFERDTGVVSSYPDSLWWAIVTIATVGYGDISPKSPNGRVIAGLTMIAGIGVFSIITAKLAEVLFISRARGTRQVISQTGHTLILGWSPKVITIVTQLVEANASRTNASVVVLCDRDPNDVLEEITSHVPELARSTTSLSVRAGSPGDPATLARVRPTDARAVIALDGGDGDAEVIRTVLALLHGRDLPPTIPLIVEIEDPGAAATLRDALDERITVVNPSAFLASTAAQACRSGSIGAAYEELLDFTGAEFYTMADSTLVGRRAGELRGALLGAVMVGVADRSGRIQLNPLAGRVLQPDERVVVIAEDDDGLACDPDRMAAMPAVDPSPEAAEPRNVMIFGWSALGAPILETLDKFVGPGSRFTIVADDTLDDLTRHRVPENLTNAEIDVRRAKGVGFADAVRVAASEPCHHALVLCHRATLTPAEADARALLTTMQVRRILARVGAATTLITELLDESDVSLADTNQAGDFLLSDRLVSLLIAQLSENPQLGAVFDDLLDPGGSQLCAIRAARYTTPGVAVTFAAIADAAANRDETAIGYHNVGSRTVINPPWDAAVTFGPDDRILVMAGRREVVADSG